MIYINVVNQRLCIASLADIYVSGSQQFVKFQFNLNKDWDGLSPFAQFRQEDKAYNQYLDDKNCVYLPAEIKEGTCTLMLYGSGHKTIATTNYLTLKVIKNNFVADASSTEISQSLYDQLLEKVSDEALQSKIDDTVKAELKIYLESGKLAEMTIKDGSLSIAKVDDNFKNTIDNKVDKVEGKGLSTNDYTDAEKIEVAKVSALPYATLSLEDYDTRKRGYIAADGEYTASGSWFSYYFYTDKYPIKKINAKLYSNSTAAYSIAFYSAKDSIASNLISGIKPTAAGANLISFDNVSVPENAALIVISTRFASGANSSAELFVNLNIPAAEMSKVGDAGSEKTGQIKRIFTDFPNANDFTFVKGELWGSAASGDKTVIHRYKITDSGLLALGIIKTDFGHLNTFDYNPANDCLIFGNGANDFSTEGNWFAVVKNPMGLVTSEYSANATLAANAIVYNVDIGFKVQAVWGASNLGLNNIVYLLSNNAKTVTKVMLNVDDNGELNGQFTVLDTHTSETAYPVGGAKFWGDTLYFGYSDTGYKIAKMSMSDYSVSVTKRQLYEANGTEISGTVQGLHIDDKYVWVFINAVNPIRYYLIQMYQCLGSLSGGSGGAGTTITVDAELSATSENPVQNKTVKAALDKKIEKPTTVKEGLFGFNSAGVETIKEITDRGNAVETDTANIPSNKALKEYVAAKNGNFISKPTSNGIVGYMSGLGTLTYTLNTSMPASPTHSGVLTAKAVKDYTDEKSDTKVDKVDGKGLSTNDFTNAQKALVEKILETGYVKGLKEDINGLIQNVPGSNSNNVLYINTEVSATKSGIPLTQAVYAAIKDNETKLNKTTSLSADSTDTQYPTAKAVYDFIMALDASEVSY